MLPVLKILSTQKEKEKPDNNSNKKMLFSYLLTGFMTSMVSDECESTKLPPIRLGTLCTDIKF